MPVASAATTLATARLAERSVRGFLKWVGARWEETLVWSHLDNDPGSIATRPDLLERADALGRRLTYTDMPLVRYAPGDLFRTYAGPCACGDPSPRVAFVGQVGAIRKIKGVLVHPAQVQATLSQFPELGNFQIVVDHPPGARYDHAVIRIGCAAPTLCMWRLRVGMVRRSCPGTRNSVRARPRWSRARHQRTRYAADRRRSERSHRASRFRASANVRAATA